MENIDQQIEDLKNKIKTVELHAAFLASLKQMSHWDKNNVAAACDRITRKMEKELKALLISKIDAGDY